MTREELIALASKAGMHEPGPLSQESGRFYPHDFAEHFAALVAAAEREECARVIEDWDSDLADPRDVAAAIRRRST